MKSLQVKRHEVKFYINPVDYDYCCSILKHLMKRDLYQKDDYGYFIRSIYLDDIYDKSVEEKLAGVERRDKYRLRIYEFDQDWAKLERKRKVGDYVQKTSGIITKKVANEVLEGKYEGLFNETNEALNSIYFDLKKSFYHPVTTIDYVRDVYILDYNDVRITFDKDIRCNNEHFNLYDPNLLTEPIQREDIIIMEIKFNNCLPSWFQLLMKPESAMKSAISKYCQSRMKSREFFFT